MGGEVSYFVEIADGQLLHVINFVKRTPIAGEMRSISGWIRSTVDY